MGRARRTGLCYKVAVATHRSASHLASRSENNLELKKDTVKMTRQTANTLGVIFGVLGILFMLAMAFGVFLPRMYALFLGVACFVIAPAFRRLGV